MVRVMEVFVIVNAACGVVVFLGARSAVMSTLGSAKRKLFGTKEERSDASA